MKYRIVHTTRYLSSEPISVGHNEAWLTPRQSPYQNPLSHALTITPEPSIASTRIDYFGNSVSQFSFNQGYQTLTVTAVNEVEVKIPSRLQAFDPPWEAVAAALGAYDTLEDLAAYEFAFESPRCKIREEFADYARGSFTRGRPILEAAMHLMRRIYEEFRYDTEATNVMTGVDLVFKQKRGVCQDFSHLMISMLRSLGLAASYVSGYLRTTPPPGKPRLVGADASHAWVSLYGGPLGWIDLDPTNNKLTDTDHITLARGRDYGDVAPLRGVYIGGGRHDLRVSVDVAEITAEKAETTGTGIA